MEGVKLYGVPSIALLLQNERLRCPSSDLVDPLWLHASEPSFQGSRSLVNLENVGGSRTLIQPVEKEEKADDDDDYEVCFHQQVKKRRLTTEQVQFLERNFEVENKLEPERKVQLARELGLQPRQVAIWFQNRRARFKTKQIEKDYGELKASFDTLKAEYDSLLQENHKLKEEVNSLKSRLIPKEKEEENLLLGDKFCDGVNSKHNNNIKHMGLVSKNEGGSGNDSSKLALPSMVMCKQEDAKSDHDVLDSEHSSLVDQEPAAADDSSHGFEPDRYSEFSQDEEDNNNNNNNNIMTLQQLLPKVEDDGGCCYSEPHESSCNFGFPVEDQPFCFWSY